MPCAAAGDQPAGDVVAQLGVLARLELGRVVGGEHVGDARARVPSVTGGIRVDPFRPQPFHLGPAFVEFDARRPARPAIGLRGRGPRARSPAARVRTSSKTILPVGARLSSVPWRSCRRADTAMHAGRSDPAARAEGMSPAARRPGSGHRQRHAHGFSALRAARGGGRADLDQRQRGQLRAAPSRSVRAPPGGSPARRGRRGPRSTSGTPASACSRSGIVSGHRAEQRHVELVGELLAAALAEDREALARRGREAGHVLDHAGDLERRPCRPSGRRGGRPSGRSAAAW